MFHHALPTGLPPKVAEPSYPITIAISSTRFSSSNDPTGSHYKLGIFPNPCIFRNFPSFYWMFPLSCTSIYLGLLDGCHQQPWIIFQYLPSAALSVHDCTPIMPYPRLASSPLMNLWSFLWLYAPSTPLSAHVVLP